MANIDKQEALYQRAREDYKDYIRQVAGPEKTREEIISAAGDIAAMQSFLEVLRTGVFESIHIDAMLTFLHPLMVLLDDWQRDPDRLHPVSRAVIDQCNDEATHQLLICNYDYASLSPEEKKLIDRFNAQYLEDRSPEAGDAPDPEQLWAAVEKKLSADYRRALTAAARLPDVGEAALAVDDLQRMYHYLLTDPMTRENQAAALNAVRHPLDVVMQAWKRSGGLCELSTVVEMAVDDILCHNAFRLSPVGAAQIGDTAYLHARQNELLRRLGYDLAAYRAGEHMAPGEDRPTPQGLQFRQDIVPLFEKYLYLFTAKMADVLLTYAHPLDAVYAEWADSFQPGEQADIDDFCEIVGWVLTAREAELEAHTAGDSQYVHFFYMQYPPQAPDFTAGQDGEGEENER